MYLKAPAYVMQDMMILDAYGAFLAEAGPQREGIAILQEAVRQQPHEGFEKYMYVTLRLQTNVHKAHF